jgi:hypothetical protein
MVVSISEQIWHNTFHQLLSNHHLFIKHVRYVDNRLIFGDKRLTSFAPYEILLDDGFYGKPIILETEPDQEFLGFMLETQPLELIYQGPTQVSQVLSPFSASPPSVLLSGFRSRCHIVIKGAFPSLRVQQGLSQLIRLYARAGFPNEELQSISNQLLIQHQYSSSAAQKTCFCCLFQGLLFLFSCVSGVVLPSCLWFLPVPARVLWCPAVSCFSPSASWLNFRFLLASSSFERSWITLKGERSIIIWPEQLCILTIWQGSCLFSNRPLNMMNRRLRQISVLIIQ